MKQAIFFLLTIGITFPVYAQQSKSADEQLLEYYQSQHYTEALKYLKTIYPEPVTDLKILSSMAYTSQMAGMLPDAENYYNRIYRLDSTTYHVLFNLGNLSLRKGNDQKAKGYFLKLLQKDSSNFVVYKNMAQISVDEGDSKAIVNYLEKANKLQPTDADVAGELSIFYAEAKKFMEAENVLGIAIDADPENIYLLQSMVKFKYAEFKFDKVIFYGEKLFELGDNSPFTRNKVGEAYFYSKNYNCGIETLSAIQPSYQNESTFYFIAACYKGLNNQSKAIEYFNKAIDAGISPNIDNYYTEIADSYITIKKDKKALGAYQKALQFNGKPMTYYLIAGLYDSQLKDKKGALKYYKKYIVSNPPEKQSKYIAYAQSRIAALRY
jgi:tetratricopeptide (TPR) repeat protein